MIEKLTINTSCYKNVLYTYNGKAYYILQLQYKPNSEIELIPIWFKTEKLVIKYIDKFEKRFK